MPPPDDMRRIVADMDRDDDAFLRGADLLLGKSQNLSYLMMGLTLAISVLCLAAVRFADLPPVLRYSFGTNCLVMAYINRRAITGIPEFRLMLDDRRLARLRAVVLTIAAADIVAFAVPLAAGLRLLSPLIGA